MTARTKEYAKSLFVIVFICLFMGLALAAVHAVAQPRIDHNDYRKLETAVTDMFGAGVSFEQMTPDDLPRTTTALYEIRADGAVRGYVAYLETKSGYGTSTFVLGVDAESGRVIDLRAISYGDSVDCGADYYREFSDKDKGEVDLVASASPARYTRAAVRDAVSEILSYLDRHHCLKGDQP
ncbi:MAG: hypothetical protein J6125_03540 [Clostridia bacterium]|nr:hypothetical protein [Clostridia bacterium]